MPGRLRCRKRKSSTSRGSRKACPSGSRCVSSVDTETCEGRSGISCECEQFSAQRRCSASPRPQPRPQPQDKENLQDQQGALCCGESMDCEDYSKTMFPDDDSNEVLPVEQFFGNMETVQDFPPKTSGPSTSAQRAQRRRRYYAPPEDSEETEDQDGGHGGQDQDGGHGGQDQLTQPCPTEEEDSPAQRH